MFDHPTGSFTGTTITPIASSVASLYGVLNGASQASKAGQQALAEITNAQNKAISLLAGLRHLVQADEQAEFLGQLHLDLFPRELNNSLQNIQKFIATLVHGGAVAPTVTASHGSQLMSDLALAIEKTLLASNEQAQTQELLQAMKKASTLANEAQDRSQTIVLDFASQQAQATQRNANEAIGIQLAGNGSNNTIHESLAQATASTSIAALNLPLSGSATGSEITATASREVTGTKKMLEGESENDGVFPATTGLSATKNSRDMRAKLQALENAIWEVQRSSNLYEQHGLTSPALTVLTRILASALAVEFSRSLNSATLATTVTTEVSAEIQNKEEDARPDAEAAGQQKSQIIGSQAVTQQASSLAADNRAGGPFANVSTLTEQSKLLLNQVAAMAENLVPQHEDASAHSMVANSANGTANSSMLSATASAILFDAVGLISREMSGLAKMLEGESENGGIFPATTELSATENSRDMRAKLQALENAVWEVQKSSNLYEQHGLTSSSLSMLARVLTSALPIELSRSLNSATLATTVTTEVSAEIQNKEEAARPDAEAAGQQKSQIIGSQAATQQASSLAADNRAGGPFANISTLTEQSKLLLNQVAAMAENLVPQHEDASAHSMVANSANGTANSSMLSATASVILFDAVGLISREMSGLAKMLEGESENGGVFPATTGLSTTENSRDMRAKLQALEEAVLNLQKALDLYKEQGLTSPFCSYVARVLASALPVEFSRSLNSATLASTALRKATVNIQAAQGEEAQALLQNAPAEQSQLIGSKEISLQGSSLPPHEGADTHFANVSTLTAQSALLLKQVEKAVNQIVLQEEDTAAHSMVATSANSTANSGTLSATASAILFDAVGLLSRELSATIHSLKNDIGTKRQAQVVSATDLEHSGKELDKLQAIASQLQERIERCQNLGASAPLALGTTHLVSTGAGVTTLNFVCGVVSACKELLHSTTKSATESNSEVLALEEAEKIQADHSHQSWLNSHEDSGHNSETISKINPSNGASLPQTLPSLFEKLVLLLRSSPDYIGVDKLKNREDLNSTARPLITGLGSRGTGFSSGVLAVLGLLTFESALSFETATRSSSLAIKQSTKASGESQGGLDQIKSLGSNVSSLCNALRMLANNVESVSSQQGTQTTYSTAETLSLRSLSAALSQANILSNVMRELTAEENDRADSTIASAAGLHLLEDKLKAALAQAEGEGIKPWQAKLQNEMAEQMATVSLTAIPTVLASHTFIAQPSHITRQGSHAGSQTQAEQQNEALTGTTTIEHTLSQISNHIQAFTINFINAMRAIQAENLQQPNSLLETHQTSVTTTATILYAISAVSLLGEELLSIHRSLSLVDAEKSKATSRAAHHLASGHAQIATAEIQVDSECGETRSLTASITALRRSLSHIGGELENFANHLDEHLEHIRSNTLKADLQMHTSQVALLQTLAFSIRHTLLKGLSASGRLSAAPATAVGSIDQLRQSAHSSDHYLQVGPVNTCQENSRRDNASASSVPTGFTLDLIASVIKNVLTILAQAGMLTLDSALAVAKVVEIMSLHRAPGEGLRLESQALSHPNGLSMNTSQLPSQASSIILSLFLKPLMENSNQTACGTLDTLVQSLQANINEAIENSHVLEDEEDGEKTNLKEFYKIIMKLMFPTLEDQELNTLAKRLDQGGLALSRYHSGCRELSVNNNNQEALEFFREFNTAQRILGHFINKAVKEFPRTYQNEEADFNATLLGRLKGALQAHSTIHTPKVQALYQHLCDTIEHKMLNQYKVAPVAPLLAPDGSLLAQTPREANIFKRDEFKRFCSLKGTTGINRPFSDITAIEPSI